MTRQYYNANTDNLAGVTGATVTTANTAGKVGIITSGGTFQADSTSTSIALFTTPPGSADQAVQAVLASELGNEGICVRASVSNGILTAYVARHVGIYVGIVRFNADGTSTELSKVTHTRKAGQTMRLTVQGSALTLLIDGAQIGPTVTDTTITAVGQCGIRLSTTIGAAVDDVYYGTIAEMASLATGALATGAVPAQVTGLVVSEPIADTVVIAWGPSTGAIDYSLEYRLTTSATWTSIASITDLTRQLDGLAGGGYLVRVRARNAAGFGPYSALSSFGIASDVQRVLYLLDVGAEGVVPMDLLPDRVQEAPTAQEVDAGYLPRSQAPEQSWSADWRTADCFTFPAPSTAITGTGQTSGHFTAVRSRVRKAQTYTRVRYGLLVAAVAPANARVAVYADTGLFLASTDTLVSDFTTTGVKTADLLTPLTFTDEQVAAGLFVYLGMGHQGSTTVPQPYRLAALPLALNADGVRRVVNNSSGMSASGPPSPNTINSASAGGSVIPWIELLPAP